MTSTGSEPFESGSLRTGSFSHTFATVGTFAYIGVWHSGMAGSITVAAATPAVGANGTTPAGAAACCRRRTAAGKLGRPRRAPRPPAPDQRPDRRRPPAFRLSESTTVAAAAFRGQSAHGTRIGSTHVRPGDDRAAPRSPPPGALPRRSCAPPTRADSARRPRAFPTLLTRRVWQRAINVRGALAKPPPAAVAVPRATLAITPPPSRRPRPASRRSRPRRQTTTAPAEAPTAAATAATDAASTRRTRARSRKAWRSRPPTTGHSSAGRTGRRRRHARSRKACGSRRPRTDHSSAGRTGRRRQHDRRRRTRRTVLRAAGRRGHTQRGCMRSLAQASAPSTVMTAALGPRKRRFPFTVTLWFPCS